MSGTNSTRTISHNANPTLGYIAAVTQVMILASTDGLGTPDNAYGIRVVDNTGNGTSADWNVTTPNTLTIFSDCTDATYHDWSFSGLNTYVGVAITNTSAPLAVTQAGIGAVDPSVQPTTGQFGTAIITSQVGGGTLEIDGNGTPDAASMNGYTVQVASSGNVGTGVVISGSTDTGCTATVDLGITDWANVRTALNADAGFLAAAGPGGIGHGCVASGGGTFVHAVDLPNSATIAGGISDTPGTSLAMGRLSLSGAKDATTIAVVTNHASITAGSSVILTATVTAPNITATGTVTFVYPKSFTLTPPTASGGSPVTLLYARDLSIALTAQEWVSSGITNTDGALGGTGWTINTSSMTYFSIASITHYTAGIVDYVLNYATTTPILAPYSLWDDPGAPATDTHSWGTAGFAVAQTAGCILGTAPLVAGIATLTVALYDSPTLIVGANYLVGDANNLPSASPDIAQNVNVNAASIVAPYIIQNTLGTNIGSAAATTTANAAARTNIIAQKAHIQSGYAVTGDWTAITGTDRGTLAASGGGSTSIFGSASAPASE